LKDFKHVGGVTQIPLLVSNYRLYIYPAFPILGFPVHSPNGGCPIEDPQRCLKSEAFRLKHSVLIIKTTNVFIMVVLLCQAVLVFGKIEIGHGRMFAEIASSPGRGNFRSSDGIFRWIDIDRELDMDRWQGDWNHLPSGKLT
jgi:hypothetical protein